jgi:hypothetical protein
LLKQAVRWATRLTIKAMVNGKSGYLRERMEQMAMMAQLVPKVKQVRKDMKVLQVLLENMAT